MCVSRTGYALLTMRTGRNPADQRGAVDGVITHEVDEPRPE